MHLALIPPHDEQDFKFKDRSTYKGHLHQNGFSTDYCTRGDTNGYKLIFPWYIHLFCTFRTLKYRVLLRDTAKNSLHAVGVL